MLFTRRVAKTVSALTLSGVVALLGAAPSGASPGTAAREARPVCEGPVLGCVRDAERTLAGIRGELGCDHRAPFPAIYVQLERSLAEAAGRPDAFEEPRWLVGSLNTGFVNLYLDAYYADRAGRPVPRAWRIAFDAARSQDVNAGQDVLLGANAHIQRDMPYVLAELGLRRADGASRKPDFDRIQAVLDHAFGPAVRDVARRYDPVVALADDRWNPIAGLTAHELFRWWREQAWDHARRLVDAADDAARDRAVRAIEANAARWAELLAAVEVPDYRRIRDGYCLRQTGAPPLP